MPPHPDQPNLTPAEWADLEERADRFHDALRDGGPVDWTPYMAGLADPVRVAVLHELVILDLAHRWAKGQKPLLDEYVGRFPELGPADSVAVKLVAEEYRVRKKHDDPVTLADYKTRFPDQYPELERRMSGLTQMGGRSVRGESTPGGRPAGGSGVSDSLAVSQRYEFIEKLGAGAFGEVWLAKKMPSGIKKAVKVITQAADKKTAKQELQALELIKNIQHPCILTVEDFWVQDNQLYVAMELADGTLRGRMKECQAEELPGIPADELIGYFKESAEGLDYLHANKITHRDVKSDNILLLKGHAKIADMGLAREQPKAMASMTFAGTPAYMAPEIWGGKGGPSSDQYSLALTYIELRQGVSAVQGGAFAEVMFAHLEGRFTFQDPITPDEQEVLLRALAKEPGERFGSCLEFVAALARAAGVAVTIRSSGSIKGGTRTPSVGGSGPRPSLLPTVGRTAGAARDTATGKRTMPDTATRPALPKKPTGRGVKLAAAGALTLALAGAIGGLIYLANMPSGDDDPDTKPTQKNGSTKPTVDDPPPPPPPPENKPKPPNGYFAPEGTKVKTIAGGRQLYERVFRQVNGAGSPGNLVHFVLVDPPAGPDSVPPFYISEHKVWEGLFDQYAKDEAKLKDVGWKRGKPLDPALGVSADDAEKFARTMLNGRLPTVLQWDHAAGFYRSNRGETVSASGNKPVVGASDPKPVFRDGDEDRSFYGVRDMAGNGREWTREVFDKPGRFVGDGPLAPDDRVILRGRSYTLTRPLTFEMLERERAEPQAQYGNKPNRYTGFRVVVEVP